MASQEHLALLRDEDGEEDEEEEDDDSSSTSTSTSTSTSDDDDDDDDVDVDDSDDDETSSEDEELSRSVAAQAAFSSLSVIEASSPATGNSAKHEKSSPSSIPAKKRVKLGFDLENRTADNSMDMDIDVSARLSEQDDAKIEAKSLLVTSEIPTVEAKPITILSSPRIPDTVPSKKLKLPPHKAIMERASTKGDSEIVVKAVVVESDDGGEDDAVAAVVEKPIPVKSKSSLRAESVTSTASGAKQQRRQANPTIKPVRFPPISSPGLLTTVPVGQYRETIDAATGLATPAAVFDHAMSLVGYTAEMRSKKPHRGSSVRRVVDDMFDSNVKFTLNFPRLIPEDLVPPNNEASTNGAPSLADRLLKAFRPSRGHPQAGSGLTNGPAETNLTLNCNGKVKPLEKGRKRKLPGFKEMAPLSLTVPYPEEYIQKRLEYVKKVNER